MTAEAAARGGIQGTDVDRILPMGGAPPLAFVIGGWIATAGDPTAVAAGRIIGTQDWYQAQNVVFPLEVLDLFVADVVRHAGTATATAGTAGSGPPNSTRNFRTAPPTSASSAPSLPTDRARPARPTVTDAGAGYRLDGGLAANGCSTIAGFVDGVLQTVFNALKVDPTEVANWINGKFGGGTLGAIAGTIGGFFASFWNQAVAFAQATLRAVLTALTAPVLNTLRSVIGALETLTIVLSYLRRWSAPITATPGANSFSITGHPAHRGSFTMTVDKDAESADWPELLADCAGVLGPALPTLSKEGAQVTWTQTGQENGLVTVDRPTGPPYNGALTAQLSDQFDYTAGSEDAATARGMLVRPTITVTAHARRTEIDQLAELLTGYLSKNFPPVIEPTVRAILGSMFGWLKTKLDQFTAVDGSATIEVDHHVKKPPPPRPAVPSCTAAGGAIPAGTYSGSIRATLISTLHISDGGQTIENAGGGNLPLTGSVTITSNGSTTTGKLVLSGAGTAQAGQQGGLVVHETDDGSLIAAISGPATAPTIEGTLSGSWASLDAPVINGSGSDSSPIHAGLHVTKSDCSTVTGDVVALFRQITLPVSQYLSISGSGMWTAVRR